MEVLFRGVRGDPIVVRQYNTHQEKELLLLQDFSEDKVDNLRQALEVLGVPSERVKELSQAEQIATLYKFREISLGDEIEVKFRCPHCQRAATADVSISGIVKMPDYEIQGIKDLGRVPTSEEDFIENFLTVDPSEMSISEFEHLYRVAQDFQTLYDFLPRVTCPLCHGVVPVDISTPEFALRAMSEDTLKSLYNTYELLIYHGRWSKGDVDTLLPFERKIFVSLLIKSLEKRLSKK